MTETDQLDIEVAQQVMGLHVWSRENSDDPIFVQEAQGAAYAIPLYTSDMVCDALVLKHIVSAWSAHRREQFWEELSKILAVRNFGFESFDLVSITFMEYYEAGDFSRAALAVVNND